MTWLLKEIGKKKQSLLTRFHNVLKNLGKDPNLGDTLFILIIHTCPKNM